MSGPGRPRIHEDDAARSAAYRERRSARLDDGEIALRQFNNPSVNFIGRCARMAVTAAPDKAATASRIIEAVLAGLKAGGAEITPTPSINFVTPRNGGPDVLG